MARAITAPELALLRTAGQYSKLYLAIQVPNVIYTAVLASVPTSTDRVAEIQYNTGSGTLADVEPGMTLYVGTSAGAFDVGMCRIRLDPDADTFFIGQTSEIDWSAAATLYLTVVDEFGLWVRPPYKASGAALKMDYDLTYSDEHVDFDPMPNLGPHAVTWLTGATVDVEFDGSGSWVEGSTVASYLWSAPGASATADLATATPTITYNAAGIYRVYCTVTATNGKSFTGVRHVFVYSAASMPVTKFNLKSNPYWDYDNGGGSFEVTMFAEAMQAEIRDRAMVILFAEDWYGATAQSIGPVTERENIVMVGWIVGESIVWDAEAGTVDFLVEDAAGMLKRIGAQICKLEFAKAVDSWGKIPGMSVDNALFHLLHWRSTVTKVMDVYLTGDTRLAPEFEAPAGSLWNQIVEMAKKTFAAPCVDPLGRLYVEIDPQMVPEADRTTIPEVMTITTADARTPLDIPRRTIPEAGLLDCSGLGTDGSGKTLTYYSLAHGRVYKHFGMPEALDKYFVTDQDDCNQRAGLAMGKKLNPFGRFTLRLAQDNRMIGIAPQQYVLLTVAAGDTVRGVEFDGRLIPRSVELEYDPETASLQTILTLEPETFEAIAVTGDDPGSGLPPSDDGGGDDDPDDPPIDPGDIGEDGPTRAILATTNMGLLYTENLHEADPVWLFWNEGLTEDQYNHVMRIHVCPSGLVVIAIGDILYQTIEYIFCAPGLGATWSLLIDRTTVDQGTYGTPGITALGVNPNVSEQIMVIGGGYTGLAVGAKYVYMGSGSGLTKGAGPIDLTEEPADVSYGLGGWLLTANRASSLSPAGWSSFTGAGAIVLTVQDFVTNFLHQTQMWHHRKASKVFVINANVGNKLRVIVGNSSPTGENIYDLPRAFGVEPGVLAVAPSGTHLMGGDSSAIGQRSSDGGATWSNVVTGGMTVGYYVWENGGDDNWWFSATTQSILRTNDFGETWEFRTGNLSTLAPLCAPRVLKVLP